MKISMRCLLPRRDAVVARPYRRVAAATSLMRERKSAPVFHNARWYAPRYRCEVHANDDLASAHRHKHRNCNENWMGRLYIYFENNHANILKFIVMSIYGTWKSRPAAPFSIHDRNITVRCDDSLISLVEVTTYRAHKRRHDNTISSPSPLHFPANNAA